MMRSFYLLLVVILANFLSINGTCQFEKIGEIRDKTQGLALDGTNPQVSLQFSDGYNSQLWKFVPAEKPGVYYIINMKTWKALDVDTTSNPNKLIESQTDFNTNNQQWYINSDGSIANAATGLYLKVHGEEVAAGVTLDLDEKADQKFILQIKN